MTRRRPASVAPSRRAFDAGGEEDAGSHAPAPEYDGEALEIVLSPPGIHICTGRTTPPRLRSASTPRQGRTGELVALRQLRQACNRGVHSALAPLIARLAEHLTSTPVPSPTP